MNRNNNTKVPFKPYNFKQEILLPPSLDELIPENHLIRIVSDVIDRLNLSSLFTAYPGGGASSYHPRMMLKVLVYAYTERIYTSRRIAKALRENIHFMWLSGMSRPDFRTIARFRSGRLKREIETIFSEVVFLLIESGHVRMENYFLDGTKFEANAGRYTWVWGRARTRFHSRLQSQLREFFREIDAQEDAESREYGDSEFAEVGESAEITGEMLEEALSRLNKQLEKKPEVKILKQHKRKIEKDYLPRQRKYEKQKEMLGGRNSCSKTDPDATFMRMKDDYMRNSQLKPAYNVQAGTENRFIVGYSFHQQTTDTVCMIEHLEKLKNRVGKPKRVIADAGYGSLENYDYLESEGVEAYVKYNHFSREQKRSWKKNRYNDKSWEYDRERDSYTCPAGEELEFSSAKSQRSRNGYLLEWRVYEGANCESCGQKQQCCPKYRRKRIWVNRKLDRHRRRVREKLTSPEGELLRKRRGTEVETAFAQIKHNMGFRRFLMRGLEKVNIEMGLLSIAHNIKKMAISNQNG